MTLQNARPIMSNLRRIVASLAAVFPVALLVVSQTGLAQSAPGPDDVREQIRETIREKIRFDLDQADRLPTAGAVRAMYGVGSDDKASAALAAQDGLVSGDNEPESEVHAAINPTDSSNIVVSPIRHSTSEGTLTCPIYYTRDFGASWHKSTFVTAPQREDAVVFGGGDPVFVYDADGALYMSWINLYIPQRNDSTFLGIFWAKSVDGGETWEFDNEHVVVADKARGGLPLGVYNLSTFSDKQWMAVDMTDGEYRNRVYLGYVELGILDGSATISVRRLPPESGKFVNQSVPVSTPDFSFAQFTSIDVDDKGVIHVTFFGFRESGGGWGLWHSYSKDGAESFTNPVRISRVRFGSERFGGNDNEMISGIQADRLYPSPYMKIDRSGGEHSGNVYAVWTALGTESKGEHGFDIYFSRLEGFGNDEIEPAWSEPIVINDDEGTTDQFYPSITVSPEGVVIVTWYDKRAEGNNATHYYMAYSFDGGKTFTKNIRVSSEATNFSTIGRKNNSFGIGEYTQVVATSGYAIPVWADGRSGDGDMDIYAAFIPITPEESDAPLYPERFSSVSTDLHMGTVQPNPVVGEEAHVDFTLARASNVTAELVNVSGEIVRELIRAEHREEGKHRLTIPTSELSAGTYFCRIATEFGIGVRRLVVTAP